MLKKNQLYINRKPFSLSTLTHAWQPPLLALPQSANPLYIPQPSSLSTLLPIQSHRNGRLQQLRNRLRARSAPSPTTKLLPSAAVSPASSSTTTPTPTPTIHLPSSSLPPVPNPPTTTTTTTTTPPPSPSAPATIPPKVPAALSLPTPKSTANAPPSRAWRGPGWAAGPCSCY